MRQQITDPIDTQEAANIIGLKIRRIRQLALSGKLDAVKFGRDWLISRQSVEAYRAAMVARKADRPGDSKPTEA